jgi:DNA-binding NarL/FixJ family response regulator
MVEVLRSSPIRLVIVEDEPLYRDLLRASLERAGFIVVGAFGDPASALTGAPALVPDVALLDIELGSSVSGVEVGIRLRRLMPGVGIVLLSNNTDPHLVASLPTDVSGGWSYLSKRTVSDVDALSRAITGAAEGLVVFDAALTRASSIRADSQGYSNKAIAQRLVLTEKSVENHLTRIYQQLGIAASDPSTHQRVQVALLYLDSTVAARGPRP